MTRYLLLSDSYGLVFVGRPLWRVAIARVVFLGSESLWTRDHILLSDLRLPFRRLLRLAGWRWRYSTQHPHEWFLPPLYSVMYLLIISWHGHHGKRHFCYKKFLFIGSLPDKRCPIVQRVCFCGNVISELLPRNDGPDHIENTFRNILYCCMRVFRTLPRNGSTCHIVFRYILIFKF
jgi:hypothetical protein